jgi:GNAT superfamily N-acetyltransferase
MEAGGAYALFDGAESPVTQTFGLGVFEPATESQLDELETFFFERGSPVNHEVSPLAGVECVRLLADRGYHPIELTSILYRPIDTPLESDTRIHVRIADRSEYQTWARVTAEGWAHEVPALLDFLSELGLVTAHKQDSPAWLAYLDGQPIAAAAQTLHEGISHMAGAATIPAARGRGAQLALLSARLRYARDQGCDLALMGATPGSASQRNAERQGFRIAYTRQKWQLPFPPQDRGAT